MTPFTEGKYAGEIAAFVPTWYLRMLIADVTGDDLRWADLSAGDKTEVIAEVAARAAGASQLYGVAAGYKLARGMTIGTATLTAVTGLTTITGFALAPVGITGTKINNAGLLSAAAQATTPGTLTIKRWKNATPSTATWVAATVAGTVAWSAIGT